MNVSVLKLDMELPTPVRAHDGDAGLDLPARYPVRLAPGERRTVDTGIAVALPTGHAGLVLPRSGLASRHGIGIVNAPGLIDSGYRGEIRVVLINLGGKEFTVSRGDRIAQLVVIPVAPVEVRLVDVLPDSERGSGGFGSSGF